MVELVNPQRTKLSREEMTSMQRAVNNSTKLIRVRDLQIVEKYEQLKAFVIRKNISSWPPQQFVIEDLSLTADIPLESVIVSNYFGFLPIEKT